MAKTKALSPIYLHGSMLPNGHVKTAPWRGRNLIAFGWYGGKFNHLKWLLPLLPSCHHYCEPFAGSAAVLLNRVPSPVETYNDVDGEVANFFRVLRDNKERLVETIGLTPFSREEYYRALSRDGHGEPLSDVELARRFFIQPGKQGPAWRRQQVSVDGQIAKIPAEPGMSGVVSRWLGSVQSLPDIATRLLRVQIENRPAVEVIKLYDSKDTLFYCDPPYVHSTRGDSKAYQFEMADKDHRELAKAIRRCKGKVAVSGYRCDLMDELYNGWRRFDAPLKQCHSIKKPRAEALWMNY